MRFAFYAGTAGKVLPSARKFLTTFQEKGARNYRRRVCAARRGISRHLSELIDNIIFLRHHLFAVLAGCA
jgi:hypothetical protein